MTLYNIWDGRQLIAQGASRRDAFLHLTMMGLRANQATGLLDRAGDPGDLAINAYCLTVEAVDG